MLSGELLVQQSVLDGWVTGGDAKRCIAEIRGSSGKRLRRLLGQIGEGIL